MPPADFRRALREADREIERQGMPAAVDARLRRRLFARGSSASRRWIPIGVVAALASATAVAVLVLRSEPEAPGPLPPVAIGDFAVRDASPDLRAAVGTDGVLRIDQGRCELEDSRWGGSIQVSD